jgi:DNA segregation ATPase FtsK/SpoIIIE-like protein
MTKAQEHRKKLRIAKRIILSSKNTSISHLQRKMHIGYSYADRLVDEISKQK